MKPTEYRITCSNCIRATEKMTEGSECEKCVEEATIENKFPRGVLR